MHRDLEDSRLVSGTRNHCQSSSYSRQIQYFGRLPLQIGQTFQDRMGIGSVESELHISNAQLYKCGFVCSTIQSQTSIICIPSSRQPCINSRRSFSELEFTSRICFSSCNSDTRYSSQDMPISVQNSSHYTFPAPTATVCRVTTTSSVSPNLSSTISKTSESQKENFYTKTSHCSTFTLGSYQSIRDKKFSKDVANFVSKSRRKSTQKVFDA